MAEKKPKGKVVDKWKSKEWYEVLAPAAFENKKVGEVVSSDPENLVNRIVPIALVEITGRMRPESMYAKALFRITGVKDKRAETEIIGMKVASSYLRALARRRKSVLHDVIDITTKDGKKVRIKTMLVTREKVSTVVKKNVRRELVAKLVATATEKAYYDLVKSIVDDTFLNEIAKSVNKINPVDSLVIKKLELHETFN
jgi:small subunit ribosomal protein S3Ae